ncbi:MAG: hypothetical protein ACTMHL_02010 [Janibacter sp.]
MIFTTLLTALVLVAAGLTPWWVAGHYSIPARERLTVREMDLPDVIATLRRGANAFVPAHLR